MRALVWSVIAVSVGLYFFIVNLDRLPEFGETLWSGWPFISIIIGLLILFRRKGRPKHDFFFNNREVEKRIEEINRKAPPKS
jgi:hypothetical protein